MFGLESLHFVGGIEVQDALAGIADHGLLSGAHIVVGLRPQHDLACHAFVIAHLGDAAAAKFGNSLVVTEEILIHAGPHLIALGAPLGELLFVLRGPLAGFNLFFLNLGGFRLQFGLGGFHFFVARVRIHHQLKDLVFGGGDLFFRKLNLVQQRLVLFVGFYVERLVAVLGNLAAKVGDCSFVFAARGFVGFDGGLGFFQLGLGVGQLVFDGGDAFGKFGDFILQAADFLVRFLQAQQVFYFWKHPETAQL